MKARHSPETRQRQREVALAHWQSVRAARAAVARAEAALQAKHQALRLHELLKLVKRRKVVDLREVRRLLSELHA